jgi:hypothetical protein
MYGYAGDTFIVRAKNGELDQKDTTLVLQPERKPNCSSVIRKDDFYKHFDWDHSYIYSRITGQVREKADEIGTELTSLLLDAKKKYEEKYADVESANARLNEVEATLNGLNSFKFVEHRFFYRLVNNKPEFVHIYYDGSSKHLTLKHYNQDGDGRAYWIGTAPIELRVAASRHLEEYMKKVIEVI